MESVWERADPLERREAEGLAVKREVPPPRKLLILAPWRPPLLRPHMRKARLFL